LEVDGKIKLFFRELHPTNLFLKNKIPTTMYLMKMFYFVYWQVYWIRFYSWAALVGESII